MKKSILIFLALVLSQTSFSQKGCQPKDCVVPITTGCKSYCDDRILKRMEKDELKEQGLKEKSIDKIEEYRKRNERDPSYEKKLIDVIGSKEYGKIHKND